MRTVARITTEGSKVHVPSLVLLGTAGALFNRSLHFRSSPVVLSSDLKRVAQSAPCSASGPLRMRMRIRYTFRMPRCILQEAWVNIW
jgi:hypothetical protein